MKQRFMILVSALATILSGCAAVKHESSAMQSLPPLRELSYIDPNDIIHQLPRDEQIKRLRSRKTSALKLLRSELSVFYKVSADVTSDGECAYVEVSTAALARQVGEAICQGEFDNTLRVLREAGFARLGIRGNWEYLSINIASDGKCGDN